MTEFSIRDEHNQDDFRLYFIVKEYEPAALQKTSDIFQKAFIVSHSNKNKVKESTNFSSKLNCRLIGTTLMSQMKQNMCLVKKLLCKCQKKGFTDEP